MSNATKDWINEHIGEIFCGIVIGGMFLAFFWLACLWMGCKI